ncbi:hypothetical protein ES706_04796 [subsurface metagenome]
MAKGGVTKKLEDAIKALDENQLKKALYLTENNPKLQRQHQYIEEAARTCLANKDNKKVCEGAIKLARDKVKETVSLPIDDTSLEGLEDYLSPEPALTSQEEKPAAGPPAAQKTDEELFQECEECHVAVAADRFAVICAEKPEETGGCELIGRSLEDEKTEPVDWLKAMIETAEKAQGSAKEEMTAALTELTNYLEGKDSSFLKELEKESEVTNAEGTAIPTRAEE